MKIKKNIKLERCPFCGSDVELQDFTDSVYGFWDYKVVCKRCRAYMNSPSTANVQHLWEEGRFIQTRNEKTKRQALDDLIMNWNRRADCHGADGASQ